MKLLLISCFFSLVLFNPQFARAQTVSSIRVDGMINPAVSDFIHHSIEKAHDANASCFIIHLNTPGGLLQSTREIVGDFLECDIPIIVYVSPGGAQAGSAGVFVTMAANIAAMAPGTNIGAAHPVTLQGGQPDSIMGAKITNDAAAFIRTIAEKRKRNLVWAEQAVRNSVSITETEALANNVIDVIAKNDRELLQKIDGQEITTSKGTEILHVSDAKIESYEMGWMERILNLLSDPNIAYILFMLGTYGLLFELYNPGSIFPGIVGVVSLLLAFYSMHTLPVNYAGLGLIIFGIILFVLEIKITSHGMLTVGGIVSLTIGSLMLIRTPTGLEVVELSWKVIIATVAMTTFFFVFLLGLGLKAQRRKPTTGQEGLIGGIGETIDQLNPDGTVRIHGELWNATSIAGKIPKNTTIRVVQIKDLRLTVEPYTSTKE
jgi:membrane-bound serine protease (ClpP class)